MAQRIEVDGLRVIEVQAAPDGLWGAERLILEDETQRYRCSEPGCDRVFDGPAAYRVHQTRTHSYKLPENLQVLTLGELLSAVEKSQKFNRVDELEQRIVDLRIQHSEELASRNRAHSAEIRKIRQEAYQRAARKSKEKMGELQKKIKEQEAELRKYRSAARALQGLGLDQGGGA